MLANGASVAQWDDLSGNNLHATQGAGAAQPTYVTSAINGRPALSFDGGDYLLNATAVTGTMTVYTVVSSSSQSGRSILDGRTAGTRLALGGNTATQIFAFGTALTVKSSASVASASIVDAVFNGASSVLGHNGSEATGDTGTSGLSTGYHLGLRQDFIAATYWLGQIGEVIVAAGAHDAAMRATVRRYLGSRYAITVP